MADFRNPGVPPSNPPSYLGYSQGTDRAKADTSLGELFGDVGQIGGAAAKAAYGGITEMIRKDLTKQLSEERDSFGVKEARDLAAQGVSPGSVKGDASNFAFDTSGAGLRSTRGAPPGVTKLGGALSNLKQAYDQGMVSDSYYYARQDSIVSQMKSRYPAFEEEIDSISKSVLGVDPANASRKAQLADLDMAERARQAGMTKSETFIQSHANYLRPEQQAQFAAGNRDPKFIAEAQYTIFSRQRAKTSVDEEKAALELRGKQGEEREKDLYKVATKEVTLFGNLALQDMSGNIGGTQKIIELFNDHARNNKPWTAAETKQIQEMFAASEMQWSTRVRNILDDPTYNDLPANKKEELHKLAMGRHADLKNMVINKDYGILSANANYVEALQNGAMRQFLSENDGAVKLSLLSKMFGPAAGVALNQTLMDPSGQGMKGFNKLLTNLNTMELATGVNHNPQPNGSGGQVTAPKTLGAVLDRTSQAAVKVPEVDVPAVARQSIRNSVTILTSKETTPEQQMNAAKVMFGDADANVVFRKFAAGESRDFVYNNLTNPRVTAKMVELGQTDPQMWERYKAWANSAFLSQTKDLVDTVNADRRDQSSLFNITLDPTSYQFKITAKPGYEGHLQMRLNRPDSPVPTVEQAVGKLNSQIRNMLPVWAHDSEDVSGELSKTFQQLGYDPKQAKDPTFYQSVGGFLAGVGQAIYGAAKAVATPNRVPGEPKKPSNDSGKATGEVNSVDPNEGIPVSVSPSLQPLEDKGDVGLPPGFNAPQSPATAPGFNDGGRPNLQPTQANLGDPRAPRPPADIPTDNPQIRQGVIKVAQQFAGFNEREHTDVLTSFIEKGTGRKVDIQKTAWCADFANSVLAANGHDGTGSRLARSFLNYGDKVEKPSDGDIVVLKRGTEKWQGHVGFVAGFTERRGEKYVRVLAGNQGNQVSVQEFPVSQVLGYRRVKAGDVLTRTQEASSGTQAGA